MRIVETRHMIGLRTVSNALLHIFHPYDPDSDYWHDYQALKRLVKRAYKLEIQEREHNDQRIVDDCLRISKAVSTLKQHTRKKFALNHSSEKIHSNPDSKYQCINGFLWPKCDLSMVGGVIPCTDCNKGKNQ